MVKRLRLHDKAAIVTSADTEVPFQDVDSAQIVWHGNYFRYFEMARVKLLRIIGCDYPCMQEQGFVLPLVDTRVRFVRALNYGTSLRVYAGLLEWQNRVKVGYEIYCKETDKLASTGYTTHCAVDMQSWELLWQTPSVFVNGVNTYLATRQGRQ